MITHTHTHTTDTDRRSRTGHGRSYLPLSKMNAVLLARRGAPDVIAHLRWYSPIDARTIPKEYIYMNGEFFYTNVKYVECNTAFGRRKI